MTGGTLMVSRAVKLHGHIKRRLEALGFQGVTVTAEEKDALNRVINELKPRLLLMDCWFYEGATPYMAGQLLKFFPWLNIAAISVSAYPADLAMSFLANGASSCIQYIDGVEEFYQGLETVRHGDSYVSRSVQERIEMRVAMPKAASELSPRQLEVVRLVCNGFTVNEIAGALNISAMTVNNHKKELYGRLNVRNENELIRAALSLGIITKEELVFFGGGFELSPKPEQLPTIRRVK